MKEDARKAVETAVRLYILLNAGETNSLVPQFTPKADRGEQQLDIVTQRMTVKDAKPSSK